MQLDIVIPALNEEASIVQVATACLLARERLLAETPLTEVTVTVVDDGSTDRTGELAAALAPEVTLVTHPVNRGYGAAIRSGFAAHAGELVAFLDADGTCDPAWLVGLVDRLLRDDLSLVCGSRLGPESHMPAVRRLGNRFFRSLLNWVAGTRLEDTASGIRVLWRHVAEALEPLPDGLHYTPTMTARAALDQRFRIGEEAVPYREREGRSKLSVWRDGLRFLQTIIEVGLTYQPLRLLAAPGWLMLFLAVVFGLPPLGHWIVVREVDDGMIYRVAFVIMAGVAGAGLLGLGLVCELMVALVHPHRRRSALSHWLDRRVTGRAVLALASGFATLAVGLLWGPIVQRLRFGDVFYHWSQVTLGIFCALLSVQIASWLVMLRTVRLLWRVRPSAPRVGPPDG